MTHLRENHGLSNRLARGCRMPRDLFSKTQQPTSSRTRRSSANGSSVLPRESFPNSSRHHRDLSPSSEFSPRKDTTSFAIAYTQIIFLTCWVFSTGSVWLMHTASAHIK